MEQGEYLRAILAECTNPAFTVRHWRVHAGLWKQANAMDARTLFDALGSANAPADRRVALDVAAMKEAMVDEDLNHLARWIPGPQQLADDLTKAAGNGLLVSVMETNRWSLVETAEVRAMRARKRERVKDCKAIAKQAIADVPRGSET